MAVERATAYESSQWGKETTYGVAVPTSKRLLLTQVDIENMPNIKPFRPQGIKFNTKVAFGKEHSTARIMGDIGYNDILYPLASLFGSYNPSTPANNASWTVGVGAASAGSINFVFNGQTASIPFASTAAAVQLLIEALSTVGTGNVVVTGASPTWVVTFVGGLSTTVIVPTVAAVGLTGGTAAITLVAAATLTRRGTFFSGFNIPDVLDSFTIEKGVFGQANLSQKISGFVASGITQRFTKDEASFQCDAFGNVTVDPSTMTTADIVNISPRPIDMSRVSVWIGTALTGTGCVRRMTRCNEVEISVTGKNRPDITLDDSVPSISAVIEGSAEWAARVYLEHDSNGQAILANMRGGDDMFLIVESISDELIETGFPYRYKVTMPMSLISSPNQDNDGIYGKNYNLQARYDTTFGGGYKIEVDSPTTAL